MRNFDYIQQNVSSIMTTKSDRTSNKALRHGFISPFGGYFRLRPYSVPAFFGTSSFNVVLFFKGLVPLSAILL